jgi:NAD(P)-dependent dehydrogenase (short-subunit alcohol dehydrogenase family)
MTRRVCLVTGGGGPAIGRGICHALATAQWQVVVADRDLTAARQVAAELGSFDAEPIELDVLDQPSIDAVVDRLLARYGRIDGLVNSAGIGLVRRAHEMSRAEFDELIAINLAGAWAVAKAVLPAMIERGAGSIVNVSSNHALASATGFTGYATTKAGLLGLTRGIAIDYGGSGIRCNAVLPGLVDGPTSRTVAEAASDDAARFVNDWVSTRQVLPRPIAPIDIGAVVEFLLSERSRAVTGAALVADAGTTALLYDMEPPR